MEPIIIEKELETPGIILDPQNKKFEFTGKSCPADVRSFYAPILSWLEKYIKTNDEDIVFDFKFQYYNTASAKIILMILQHLEDAAVNGNVLVKWHYPEEDEELMEAGEDFADIVDVPFEFVQIVE